MQTRIIGPCWGCRKVAELERGEDNAILCPECRGVDDGLRGLYTSQPSMPVLVWSVAVMVVIAAAVVAAACNFWRG